MLRPIITSSTANTDDNSCVAVVEGCTDATAFNFDTTANTDDNSCIEVVEGCTDATAFNYSSTANTDEWFLYSSYRRLYRCYGF